MDILIVLNILQRYDQGTLVWASFHLTDRGLVSKDVAVIFACCYVR